MTTEPAAPAMDSDVLPPLATAAASRIRKTVAADSAGEADEELIDLLAASPLAAPLGA